MVFQSRNKILNDSVRKIILSRLGSYTLEAWDPFHWSSAIVIVELSGVYLMKSGSGGLA